MIYELKKIVEIEKKRQFSVSTVEFPKVLFSGGTNVYGEYKTLSYLDVLTGEIECIPMTNEDKEKIKRIGHTMIIIKNKVYIIGGAHRFQKSVLLFDLKTRQLTEFEIEFELSHHVSVFHSPSNMIITFSGKEFIYMDEDVKIKETIKIPYQYHNNQTRFKGVLCNDWFYIFGGYNGISFGKRFFRFHLFQHKVECLPSIPNSFNVRITGVEIICIRTKLYFIMNTFSLSRNNFLYVYDTISKTWENFFILKYGERKQCIDIHADNKLDIGLSTGMKTYGSFQNKNKLYIFGSDAIFFDYPNVIYELSIPSINETPIPRKLFNDKNTCDFTLHVNSIPFYCHRCILCKYSNYFYVMFHSNFIEGKCHEVYLDFEDPTVFEHILRYMYEDPTFDVRTCQEYELENIVEIADYFEIPTLLFDIENYFLHKFITEKTFPLFLTKHIGFTRLRELQNSKLKLA